MTHDHLIERIRETALLRGDFTLRSGRKSKYYLDKYLFETQPDILAALGERFKEVVDADPLGIDRLAGPELGGIPLVTATGLVLQKPTVFIRNQKKDYGTAQQLEGELNSGDRVVMLEDVATTAGQAIEACKTIETQGAVVVAAIAVIDRGEGAAENMAQAGYRFERLFTTADLGVTGE